MSRSPGFYINQIEAESSLGTSLRVIERVLETLRDDVVTNYRSLQSAVTKSWPFPTETGTADNGSAQRVAKQMKKRRAHYATRLGDIYYAGQESEANSFLYRFRDIAFGGFIYRSFALHRRAIVFRQSITFTSTEHKLLWVIQYE